MPIKFRAEVDVWIDDDISQYVGKTGTTAMLNELAKQQISRDITDALTLYGLNNNVFWVSKSTK